MPCRVSLLLPARCPAFGLPFQRLDLRNRLMNPATAAHAGSKAPEGGLIPQCSSPPRKSYNPLARDYGVAPHSLTNARFSMETAIEMVSPDGIEPSTL